jgi:hypothetical protein
MNVAELTKRIQYTVDQDGQVTAVVLPPELWRRILEALEDGEERALVQALYSRLVEGPAAAGALRWPDVTDQWL